MHRETDKDWLIRLAGELKEQMPHLSTKIKKNGKIRLVKVDFLKRLKEIYKAKGQQGVEDYVEFAVKDYNQKVKAVLKKQVTAPKLTV